MATTTSAERLFDSLARVVYQLVYPALLGSMVYQLFFDLQLSWNQNGISGSNMRGSYSLLRFLVVMIYCLDWIYVSNFRRFAKECAHKVWPTTWAKIGVVVCELASALLFLFAFKLLTGPHEGSVPGETLRYAAVCITGVVFLYLMIHAGLGNTKLNLETTVLGWLLPACVLACLSFFLFKTSLPIELLEWETGLLLLAVLLAYFFVVAMRIHDGYSELKNDANQKNVL